MRPVSCNFMSHYITIFFLLLLLTFCTDKKSNEKAIDCNVTVNLDLRKISTDTLDIDWKGINREKYSWSFFADNEGICRLSSDTLFISTHQGFGPSNTLDITIANGKWEAVLIEHDCTYGHKYKVIKQSLELNKSTFMIGDTITGKLFYQAVYVWDTIKNIVDTTTISGKFKLKIRDKYFDWNSLQAANKYKELLEILLKAKADTVTHVQFRQCGLTSLPIELRKFKNLESLVLNENDFKNADLSMLCEFKKLKILQIDNCNLSKVPESIFCLKNLEELSLFGNEISSLPKEMFFLTKIIDLQLGDNLLTILPNEILNLKKLKRLVITGKMERNNIEKLPTNFFNVLQSLTEFYPPDFLKADEYKDYKPKFNL